MKERVILHSRAFLVEFIICTFFLSIVSAIVLRVFVKGHELRQKAKDLTEMTAKIQSIAEYAKSSRSQEEYVAYIMENGAVESGGQYIFYYDKNWEVQNEKKQPGYRIRIIHSSQGFKRGELLEINLTGEKINSRRVLPENSEEGDEICRLRAAKYYANQERRGKEE